MSPVYTQPSTDPVALQTASDNGAIHSVTTGTNIHVKLAMNLSGKRLAWIVQRTFDNLDHPDKSIRASASNTLLPLVHTSISRDEGEVMQVIDDNLCRLSLAMIQVLLCDGDHPDESEMYPAQEWHSKRIISILMRRDGPFYETLKASSSLFMKKLAWNIDWTPFDLESGESNDYPEARMDTLSVFILAVLADQGQSQDSIDPFIEKNRRSHLEGLSRFISTSLPARFIESGYLRVALVKVIQDTRYQDTLPSLVLELFMLSSATTIPLFDSSSEALHETDEHGLVRRLKHLSKTSFYRREPPDTASSVEELTGPQADVFGRLSRIFDQLSRAISTVELEKQRTLLETRMSYLVFQGVIIGIFLIVQVVMLSTLFSTEGRAPSGLTKGIAVLFAGSSSVVNVAGVYLALNFARSLFLRTRDLNRLVLSREESELLLNRVIGSALSLKDCATYDSMASQETEALQIILRANQLADQLSRTTYQARRLQHLITSHLDGHHLLTLSVNCSTALLLTSICLFLISTWPIYIWLPVVLVMSLSAAVPIRQELSHRPGVLARLRKLIKRPTTQPPFIPTAFHARSPSITIITPRPEPPYLVSVERTSPRLSFRAQDTKAGSVPATEVGPRRQEASPVLMSRSLPTSINTNVGRAAHTPPQGSPPRFSSPPPTYYPGSPTSTRTFARGNRDAAAGTTTTVVYHGNVTHNNYVTNTPQGETYQPMQFPTSVPHAGSISSRASGSPSQRPKDFVSPHLSPLSSFQQVVDLPTDRPPSTTHIFSTPSPPVVQQIYDPDSIQSPSIFGSFSTRHTISSPQGATSDIRQQRSSTGNLPYAFESPSQMHDLVGEYE
ncbi:hypothetical protein FA15DRAFT_672842 [Coprinopsis marcescibilis]|uniref:Transmembrane protein n=1 Tax=Coprinopsis marcescibilis TaxID=230819 RepID=A0A5C3KMN5_COPMA|nr:hypothetical protein FA15DRAFT_672842 [Coprinopsis marcescibilis]